MTEEQAAALKEAERRIAEAGPEARVLDLSRLGLTQLPASLAQLTKLETLHLSFNQLTQLPDSLAQLSQLQTLELSRNQLTQLPDWLGELSQLQRLHLSGNQLTQLPNSLAQLSQLQFLNLVGNQLTQLPDSLAQLTKLETLHLSFNQLTQLPDSLAQLSQLQTLELSRNQLTQLPDWLGELPLVKLGAFGNPLPPEIAAVAERGMEAMAEYVRALRHDSVFPRTVKVVLLGEPKAGKTTLRRALSGMAQPCDPKLAETVGVEVSTLKFQNPQDHQPMFLNVWDFAGQDIEHATHQFFLTEQAIYLILWERRLGTESGVRDLDYWLNLLRMKVRNSRFLLVSTHTDITPDIGIETIKRTYGEDAVLGHYGVNLCNGKGFPELRARLLQLAAESPAMKLPWRGSWRNVRDYLRSVRSSKPIVSSEQFRELLLEKGVTSTADQDALRHDLNFLGEIIFRTENEDLTSHVVIDPTWATNQIAKIVRCSEVGDRGGVLTREDLTKHWGDLPVDVRRYLLFLMDAFDVTYDTKTKDEIGLVVPKLPERGAAVSPPEWDQAADKPEATLIFKFDQTYRHLPPGIPTWTIARAHKFRSDTRPHRDLAFFSYDGKAQARLLADNINRTVELKVRADYPPRFLGIVQDIFLDTVARYPGLKPEIHVPCVCNPECGKTYPQEFLETLFSEGDENLRCEWSRQRVSVKQLLSGVNGLNSLPGPEAYRALREELLAWTARIFNAVAYSPRCPSIFQFEAPGFQLLPQYGELKQRLQLTLYCEAEGCVHATQDSVYQFDVDDSFLARVKPIWNEIVSWSEKTRPIINLASKVYPAVNVPGLPQLPPDPSGKLAATLKELAEDKSKSNWSAVLEELLTQLDKDRPPQNRLGGFQRHASEKGNLVWLCPDHFAEARQSRRTTT